jgi:hypothetical protein
VKNTNYEAPHCAMISNPNYFTALGEDYPQLFFIKHSVFISWDESEFSYP